ncbi:MAG: hypothetical protein FWC41_11905 [Firmicutes bacterium]|nr:hypothetical protein [Bacillota bacterium]
MAIITVLNTNYNDFGCLTQVDCFNDKNEQTACFKYIYDDDYKLTQVFDIKNNTKTKFQCNEHGDIVGWKDEENFSANFVFDYTKNIILETIAKIFGLEQTTKNTFNSENILEFSEITLGNTSIFSKYTYDDLSRINLSEILNSSKKIDS